MPDGTPHIDPMSQIFYPSDIRCYEMTPFCIDPIPVFKTLNEISGDLFPMDKLIAFSSRNQAYCL